MKCLFLLDFACFLVHLKTSKYFRQSTCSNQELLQIFAEGQLVIATGDLNPQGIMKASFPVPLKVCNF